MKHFALKVFCILYAMTIHPIKFLNGLEHCQKYGHRYELMIINWRVGMQCHDCTDCIFIDD